MHSHKLHKTGIGRPVYEIVTLRNLFIKGRIFDDCLMIVGRQAYACGLDHQIILPRQRLIAGKLHRRHLRVSGLLCNLLYNRLRFGNRAV